MGRCAKLRMVSLLNTSDSGRYTRITELGSRSEIPNSRAKYSWIPVRATFASATKYPSSVRRILDTDTASLKFISGSRCGEHYMLVNLTDFMLPASYLKAVADV